MKKKVTAVVLLIMAGFLSQPVPAEQASAERGEMLFNDPGLGGSANSASCGTCHPGGRNLEAAGGKPDLREMINLCIERPLKGQRLPEDSVEMESLMLYIRALDK